MAVFWPGSWNEDFLFFCVGQSQTMLPMADVKFAIFSPHWPPNVPFQKPDKHTACGNLQVALCMQEQHSIIVIEDVREDVGEGCERLSKY